MEVKHTDFFHFILMSFSEGRYIHVIFQRLQLAFLSSFL